MINIIDNNVYTFTLCFYCRWNAFLSQGIIVPACDIQLDRTAGYRHDIPVNEDSSAHIIIKTAGESKGLHFLNMLC